MPVPATVRPRRRRACLVAAALAAVVLVAGAASWFWWTDRALSTVEVVPRSMHCGAHDTPYVVVAPDAASGLPPFIGFDLTLRPDSFCQLEISIVNTGKHAVHLDRATFRALGSGRSGAAPLEITENGGPFTREGSSDGSSDDIGAAVFPIDDSLGAGEVRNELYDLRTRASRFTGDRDLIMTLSDMPQIRISHLGRSRTVDGSVGLRIRQER